MVSTSMQVKDVKMGPRPKGVDGHERRSMGAYIAFMYTFTFRGRVYSGPPFAVRGLNVEERKAVYIYTHEIGTR